MERPLRPRAALLTLACVVGLVLAPAALANHPVYVEGNCLNPPAGNPGPVLVGGVCGDYDGDLRIGTAEDADGDRVFGTIAAALGGGTGANQNGRVTIVTSGVFAEVVNITAANGNVTLEGAPGVEANIDAVLQGDPGSGARQSAPGIIVNAPADRRVTIRNVMSRNWTIGYDIRGDSFVTLDGVRAENNTNYGVRVQDRGRVAITGSSVQATGFRVGGAMDFPRVNLPMPGIGISYEGSASGVVCWSTVTGSFRAGISNTGRRDVKVSHDTVFGNNPGLAGDVDREDDCVERGSQNDDDDDSFVPFWIGGSLAFGFFGLALIGAALLLPRSRRVTSTA